MKRIAYTTLGVDHGTRELGLNIAKNFLLTGPPGTETTITAKAFAKHADIYFRTNYLKQILFNSL